MKLNIKTWNLLTPLLELLVSEVAVSARLGLGKGHGVLEAIEAILYTCTLKSKESCPRQNLNHNLQ